MKRKRKFLWQQYEKGVLQALETYTCALYLYAIMIFYDAKEFPIKELSHERS